MPTREELLDRAMEIAASQATPPSQDPPSLDFPESLIGEGVAKGPERPFFPESLGALKEAAFPTPQLSDLIAPGREREFDSILEETIANASNFFRERPGLLMPFPGLTAETGKVFASSLSGNTGEAMGKAFNLAPEGIGKVLSDPSEGTIGDQLLASPVRTGAGVILGLPEFVFHSLTTISEMLPIQMDAVDEEGNPTAVKNSVGVAITLGPKTDLISGLAKIVGMREAGEAAERLFAPNEEEAEMTLRTFMENVAGMFGPAAIAAGFARPLAPTSFGRNLKIRSAEGTIVELPRRTVEGGVIMEPSARQISLALDQQRANAVAARIAGTKAGVTRALVQEAKELGKDPIEHAREVINDEAASLAETYIKSAENQGVVDGKGTPLEVGEAGAKSVSEVAIKVGGEEAFLDAEAAKAAEVTRKSLDRRQVEESRAAELERRRGERRSSLEGELVFQERGEGRARIPQLRVKTGDAQKTITITDVSKLPRGVTDGSTIRVPLNALEQTGLNAIKVPTKKFVLARFPKDAPKELLKQAIETATTFKKEFRPKIRKGAEGNDITFDINTGRVATEVEMGRLSEYPPELAKMLLEVPENQVGPASKAVVELQAAIARLAESDPTKIPESTPEGVNAAARALKIMVDRAKRPDEAPRTMVVELAAKLQITAETAKTLLESNDPLKTATKLEMLDPKAVAAEVGRVRGNSPVTPLTPNLPDIQPQLAEVVERKNQPIHTKMEEVEREILKREIEMHDETIPPGTPEGGGGYHYEGASKRFSWLNILNTPLNSWFRLDPRAGLVAEEMAYATTRMGRLKGANDAKGVEILSQIPKKGWRKLLRGRTKFGKFAPEVRGKGSEPIADILDGATRKDIEARTDLSPDVKNVALQLRDHLDGWRDKIVDFYENELGYKVPKDWGMDGYLPHIFDGTFIVRLEGTKGGKFVVGSANWRGGAEKVAREAVKDFDIPIEKISIEANAFISPNAMNPKDAGFNKLIGQLVGERRFVDGKAFLPESEVMAGVDKIIAPRKKGQKFSQFLRRRKGATGYTKDLTKIFDLYHRSVVRWTELTKLNKNVSPIIENVKRVNETLGAEMERVFDTIWGKQGRMSKITDATIQSLPILRDTPLAKGFAYERIINRMQNETARLLLFTTRFGILNSMQPFQTLWPTVKTGEFMRGVGAWFTDEGHALLEGEGVQYDVRRWIEGPIAVSKFGKDAKESSNILARLARRSSILPSAAEARNQGIAWLTWYHKSKKAGMDHAAASRTATLKGQFYTQFLGSLADRPGFVRGPGTAFLFQFKRFQIKNLEMGYNMVKSKDYPGAMKWLVANALVGGTRQFTRIGLALKGISLATAKATGQEEAARVINKFAPADLPLKQYKAIREEAGESVANAATWGLPALAGVDMSYSVQFLDLPHAETVPEALMDILGGAGPNLALTVGGAATSTEGPFEVSGPERAAKTLIRRAPALRFVEGAFKIGEKLIEGKNPAKEIYDFTTPGGRLQFRTDFEGLLAHLFGFRTLDQAKQDLLLDSYVNIYTERDAIITKTAQSIISDGNVDGAMRAVSDFNQMWPEFVIQSKDIGGRMVGRLRSAEMEQVERFLSNAPKVFRGMGQIELEGLRGTLMERFGEE